MRRSIVNAGVLVIVMGLIFVLIAYVAYEEKKDHYAKKIFGDDWRREMEQDPEWALEEIKEEMEKDKAAMAFIDGSRIFGWGSVLVGVIILIAGLVQDEKATGSQEEKDEDEGEEGPFIDRSDRTPYRNYPNCPGCGRSLKFPFMPKNCPYCNEEIVETVKNWLLELEKEQKDTEHSSPIEVREDEGEENKEEKPSEPPSSYKIQCPACNHINSYEKKLHHLECEKCLSVLRVKYDRFHNPFIYGHT